MVKTADGIETALVGIASLWSINNIESILGVIILVIQIIWFIVRTSYIIYRKIKSGGDITELDGDIESSVEILKDIQNNIIEERSEDNADTK